MIPRDRKDVLALAVAVAAVAAVILTMRYAASLMT